MRRTRFAITLGCLIALSATTAATLRAASQAPSKDDSDPLLRSGYVERVEVSFVMLHAAVLNRRGEAVTGLQARDFQVLEDGATRPLAAFGSSADQPVRVAFLLDVSGSMALLDRLKRAKDAIRHFADSLLEEDQIALLIFADGEVNVKVPFTSDRGRLDAALDSIDAYGRTALRNALAEAPDLLSATAQGRKALVILTDGGDNASTISMVEAIQSARRAAVPIFVVGMTDLPLDLLVPPPSQDGGSAAFKILTEFTHGTGGEFFPVFGAEEISAAVSRMEELIRAQYILGYKPGPTSSLPGFHRIEVRTRNARYRIITRDGYVTVD